MPYQAQLSSFRHLLLNLLTTTISRLETWKSYILTQETSSSIVLAVSEEKEATTSSETREQQQLVEQDNQESIQWQMLPTEEELRTAQAIADIQPRQAYVPGNIRDTPLVNTTKELLAQYIEQHRSTRDPITHLMELADRFHCTTEMATFLAIMSIGGPQRLLHQNAEWDVTTRHAVSQLHMALRKGCTDDLEFSLKLYAAWSLELQEEQVFIQPAALARTWHQRRIPALSTEMHEALNTRITPFLQAVLQATTFTQIRTLVEHYGIKNNAENWLQETEKVFFAARQEARAITFFINYGLFRSKVELERERLLSILDVNKKNYERRSIHFELLHKVRLLFTYAQAQRDDIPAYTVRVDLDVERKLRQAPLSLLDLARFLAEKTRTNQEALIPTFVAQRLFLDQTIPLGSHYRCRVTSVAPTGKALVQLAERIADPPPIQESFRTITSGSSSFPAPSVKASSEHATHTPQSKATNITGVLFASTIPCIVGDVMEVAVTSYVFDDLTHPHVIVELPPAPSQFELFCQHYQVGDVPDVIVRGYEEYTSDPAHPRVALLVQEQVSLLQITVEPEHISFLDIGEAIQEIPVGTTLRLPINDIDREREVVIFSSLPLVEVHLNKRLQQLTQENAAYVLDATIRGAEQDKLLLELPWHAPTAESGLVYIVSTGYDAHKLTAYQIGDKAKISLFFPERSASNLLVELPHEVRQALDLQTGVQRLFWEQHRLHFQGRMPYATYRYFFTLSSDRAYQQALLCLYRSTHQFALELIAIASTTNQLTAVPADQATLQDEDEMAQQEDLVEDLLQTNRSGLSSTFGQTADVPEESPLLRYKTGSRARGRVISVRDFGAFVEIEPEVEGLIHKSKMWGYVTDARSALQPDEQVEVLILGLNAEKDKLELSMRIPELNPLLDYKEWDTVQGVITNVQEFGAFVDIKPGVSGFVHKSKMWGFVPDAHDIVHVGQWITALVLEVSLEKGGLTLSMEVPEHDPLQYYEAGQTAFGRVSGILYYGAFVDFGRGIKGLIPSHYIREGLADARRSSLRVHDEVTVLIVRVNWEDRNLELSLIDAS